MYIPPAPGFRGFVWEPSSEQDVVVLFGRLLRARDQEIDTILALIRRLLAMLETHSLLGTLWIVDERRVRIRR